MPVCESWLAQEYALVYSISHPRNREAASCFPHLWKLDIFRLAKNAPTPPSERMVLPDHHEAFIGTVQVCLSPQTVQNFKAQI